MGKYRTLASNTLIFAVCNFTSKLLVFLMLPLYTTVLSKSEFGTVDLIASTVGLLSPILTLSVSEGCMRYAMDKSQNVKQIFSFGLLVILIGFIVLLIASPLLKRVSFLDGHIWIFYLFYTINVVHAYLSLFARGIGKVKLVGVAGVTSSLLVVVLNLILLLVFRCGIKGYLLAIIIAQLCSSLILFVGGGMYNYITSSKNNQLSKAILTYSAPMIPNALGWWITTSASRYILGYFGSVSEVGLFSAAYKMPVIIDTFRGIFVQAWQLSTINEYDKTGSTSFFFNIYRAYNVFIILICSLLIVFSKIIATVLYSTNFFEAWTYTPLLMVSVLFGSLITFYQPFYLAHKKTKILFIATILGAIVSILANIILVPRYGIIGATISSTVSYFIIYLYLSIDSRKYLSFPAKMSYIISYVIITLQAVLISIFHFSPTGLISLILFSTIVVFNYHDIRLFSVELSKYVQKRMATIFRKRTKVN